MKKETEITQRPPVVAIMGHIDHGKSTLLSYIRKSKEPLNEAGGITQHISAYEVEHLAKDGKKHTITFVDTPGHEAFMGIRRRGASVADVVVLVVSAEDGVKPQTLEALSLIKKSNTPYIIAINKIDKPEANIERTKQNLAENEIYIEGYGGDISCVPVSAKTGEGMDDLLDIILLTTEMEGLKGDAHKPAEGVVIESNRDIKKGISATCIVKDGMIEKGMFIVSGTAISPVRIMENYMGKPLEKATFSSPIKIIGWDKMPEVGDSFKVYSNRDEAREQIEKEIEKNLNGNTSPEEDSVSTHTIPFILKADTGSSLEAITSEIRKLSNEKMCAKIIFSGIGAIGESDVRSANGKEKAIIVGFNVKIDSTAKHLADRDEIEIKTFEIIYKMNEWVKEILTTRTPKEKVVESLGRAKVVKIFSKIKDKQILGGRVEKGSITLGAEVKIIRRDVEIGVGKVRELQQQKVEVTEVKEGREFGSLIVSNVEIAPGDYIDSFIIVEK